MRCLCSVLSQHPGSLILLTDNESPATANQFAVSQLAGHFGSGQIVVCRHTPSVWSFGALDWAAQAALSLGAKHFAYLQHTMQLRRQLPLSSLTERNCSLMNFQHFSGSNFDTEERLKKWILKSWMLWQAKLLGLDGNRIQSGIYSHAFVAEASALRAFTSRGVFRLPLCSKFQDQGAERLLGLAADELLTEHEPQKRCSIDGPLFRYIANASATVSMAAADAFFASEGASRGAVMQKISHIKPTSTAWSRSDDRTIPIADLHRGFWQGAERTLAETCGAKSLERIRTSTPTVVMSPASSRATPAPPSFSPPSALDDVRAALVCISAYYVPSRAWADALSMVVSAALEWRLPTVHVAVTTQNANATASELRRHGLMRGSQDSVSSDVSAWTEDASPRAVTVLVPTGSVGALEMRPQGTSLTWFHRTIWQQRQASYQLFVYLEHDVELRWEHLAAWGVDEHLLASAPLPRGSSVPFKRGFYR